MREILLVTLWGLLVVGGTIAFVLSGIWAFVNGHYFVGGAIALGWFVFAGTYAATERFTKWPARQE